MGFAKYQEKNGCLSIAVFALLFFVVIHNEYVSEKLIFNFFVKPA